MATLDHNINGPADYVQSLTLHVLNIWPEFTDIFDKVSLIYAGFHPEYSFFTRSITGLTNQLHDEYNNGKRHFMFECLGECISPEVITKIHACAEDFAKKHDDVTIYHLTGAYNATELYKAICSDYALTPFIRVMGSYYFEFVNSKTYPRYNNPYQIGNREKNFVCLNKVYRQHRIDLLELMLRDGLINDKCYYSFYDNSGGSRESELVGLLDEYYPNIKSNLDFIKTLQLNFDETRTNPVDIREEDLILFDNSYFSVVPETVYYSKHYTFPKKAKCHVSDVEPGIFLTEKTTKVLALKHPFIIASVPNILVALRDRGYKTFHPYIDESYDTIEDDDLRLEAIVNEVKRLSNQTTDEWLEWTKNIKPIVEHNYELFFNHTSFSA